MSQMNSPEWDDAITRMGTRKAGSGIRSLFLLGLLGGLYISFGGHLFLAALASGSGRVAASFLFSTGLVLVVIAGAELFTGNILMVTGILKRHYGLRDLLRNWIIVYLGNLIASVGYAILVWQSGLFGEPGDANALGILAETVADAKVLLPFGQALIRGILCNILVVLAIIMAVSSRDMFSKILCCMLPVGAFVTIGFEHCVANMFLIPIGYLSAGIPLGEWGSMVPGLLTVTLGNILGGIFIIMIHPRRLYQLALRKTRT